MSEYIKKDRTNGPSCKHPQCSAEVSPSQYACNKHWAELPIELREELSKNFKVDFVKWHKANIIAERFWLNQIPRLM